MKVTVTCRLDPHDVFMGVYWKRARLLSSWSDPLFRPVTTIYICPLFCFVVCIEVTGSERPLREGE